MAALVENSKAANFFAARFEISTSAPEFSTDASEISTDAPEFSMTRSKFFTRGAAFYSKATAIDPLRPPISTAGPVIVADRLTKKGSAAAKIFAALPFSTVTPNFSTDAPEIHAAPSE